jgi:glycosyltransferase involved in cell wall biosynthesis
MERTGTSLSAAMIVRDEEAFLEGCLSSIRPIVDEIVVVDTGSIDSTRDIARRYDARIFELPWKDDFAAARNHALDRAQGDWILYIDADERLRVADRSALIDRLADPDMIGYQVRFFPAAGFTGYWEYRLFRNDPRIRFANPIHEGMLDGMMRLCDEEGRKIGRLDIAIDHLGYDGDQNHKHRRNLPLLRKGLGEDPDRVFSWSHLGRALMGLGDADQAIEAWWSGIEASRRQTSDKPDNVLPYLDLIPVLHERGGDAAALLVEAQARFPGDMMLVWLAARMAMDQEDYSEAANLLEGLAAIDGDSFFDGGVAYDRRIFEVFAFESLGTCYFRLGRFADSARNFARAEAADPDNPSHRVRRQLAERKAAAA